MKYLQSGTADVFGNRRGRGDSSRFSESRARAERNSLRETSRKRMGESGFAPARSRILFTIPLSI